MILVPQYGYSPVAMPTTKRERQRANRAKKLEEQQKLDNRRKLRKRAIRLTVVVVIVALVLLLPRTAVSRRFDGYHGLPVHTVEHEIEHGVLRLPGRVEHAGENGEGNGPIDVQDHPSRMSPLRSSWPSGLRPRKFKAVLKN